VKVPLNQMQKTTQANTTIGPMLQGQSILSPVAPLTGHVTAVSPVMGSPAKIVTVEPLTSIHIPIESIQPGRL
jgi:hypothetical protein